MSVYEGKENYIFISYSHKDNAVVLPLIEAIQKAGFRVWFDEGIEPGSEWPEYIETHLMGSACVLAFISPASVESPFCRKEIGLAISHNDSNDKDKKHIDFLSVYLEKTELKYGLGLLIGNSQSLFRYNYNSDAEFLTDILTAPKLQSCKIGSHVDTSVANDVKLPSRSGSADDNPLLRRAIMFLEDKDWENADAYFEKVLDSDPENASAYLGKLMVDFKINTLNMIFWLLEHTVKNSNFNKFLRFASDEEKLFVAEEAMFSIYGFAKNISLDEKLYKDLPEAIKALDDIKQYFDLLLNREEAYKESKQFDECTRTAAFILADVQYKISKNIDEVRVIFDKLQKSQHTKELIVAWYHKNAEIAKEKNDFNTVFILYEMIVREDKKYVALLSKEILELHERIKSGEKFNKLPDVQSVVDLLLEYKINDNETYHVLNNLLASFTVSSAITVLKIIDRLLEYGAPTVATNALLRAYISKWPSCRDKLILLARLDPCEETDRMIEQVRKDMEEEAARFREEEARKKKADEIKREQEAKKRAEEKARKEQEKKERLEAERKAAELQEKIAHVKFLFPILLASLFGIIMSILTSYDVLDYDLTHPWIYYFIISFAVMSITSAFAGPFRKLGLTITGVSGVIQLLGWYNFNHIWIEGDNKEWQSFYEEFNPSFIAALIVAAICLIIYYSISKKKKR